MPFSTQHFSGYKFRKMSHSGPFKSPEFDGFPALTFGFRGGHKNICCHGSDVSAEAQPRRRLVHHPALRRLLVPAVPDAQTGLRYLSGRAGRRNSRRDTPTNGDSEGSARLYDFYGQRLQYLAVHLEPECKHTHAHRTINATLL